MLRYLLPSTLILIVVFGFLNLTRTTLAQQTANCAAGTFSEGLVTGGGSLTNVSAVNANCITGNEVVYDKNDLPSYQTLKKNYYEKAKSNPTTLAVVKPIAIIATQKSIDDIEALAPSGKSAIYNFKGKLSIDDEFANNKNTKLIFVDGDLDIGDSGITVPFTTSGSEFKYDNPQGGVIFIVQGSISIASTITRLDAVLIAYGLKADSSIPPKYTDNTYTICTSYKDGGCMLITATGITPPLTVNGSLISLNADNAITFSRNNSSSQASPQPAELVNQQPKFLVILKDLLTSTLEIRTEE